MDKAHYPPSLLWASRCIVAGALLGALWLALRYLTGIVLPPLLGYGIAAIIRRLGKWLSRHSGDKKRGLGPVGERVCGMGLAVALCLLLFWGIYRGTAVLGREAAELVERAAQLWNPASLPGWLTDRIPAAWQTQLSGAVTALVERAAGSLASAAGSLVSSLPTAALSAVLTIASVFYWVVDREGILAAFKNLLPDLWKNSQLSEKIKTGAGSVSRHVGGLARTYASITAILFLLFSCGLSLLGIPSPLAWACLIAFVDLLPLLGAGAVLVPWAIWMFLTGKTMLGIGLLVLWILAWLLHQWLEPRLLGKITGTHPYIMLLLLYGGYRLGSVGGAFTAAILGGVWSADRSP